ncbi:PAH2, partial [Symbiodinium sp. KB8]
TSAAAGNSSRLAPTIALRDAKRRRYVSHWKFMSQAAVDALRFRVWVVKRRPVAGAEGGARDPSSPHDASAFPFLPSLHTGVLFTSDWLVRGLCVTAKAALPALLQHSLFDAYDNAFLQSLVRQRLGSDADGGVPPVDALDYTKAGEGQRRHSGSAKPEQGKLNEQRSSWLSSLAFWRSRSKPKEQGAAQPKASPPKEDVKAAKQGTAAPSKPHPQVPVVAAAAVQGSPPPSGLVTPTPSPLLRPSLPPGSGGGGGAPSSAFAQHALSPLQTGALSTQPTPRNKGLLDSPSMRTTTPLSTMTVPDSESEDARLNGPGSLLEEKIGYSDDDTASVMSMEAKVEVGANAMEFRIGKRRLDATLFLYTEHSKIVVSDVDGTITKSDLMGHVMFQFGFDWTQPGVASLYSDIHANGYEMLYLTSRAIGQKSSTDKYLRNIIQETSSLPFGPVITSPDRLHTAFTREVIRRRPQEFKIEALSEILRLFPPGATPFYAGFGNRPTDVVSYRAVGIPDGKIFIINPRGEIHVAQTAYRSSYSSLNDIVDAAFPPVSRRSTAEPQVGLRYGKPVEVHDAYNEVSTAAAASLPVHACAESFPFSYFFRWPPPAGKLLAAHAAGAASQ